MGLLTRLQIIPFHTSYVWGDEWEPTRRITTVLHEQEKFASALGVKGFTDKDWFDYNSPLANFIEEMHYGDRDVPKSISPKGIFAADPELATCTRRGEDHVCLAAMLDVDSHGREKEIGEGWDEIRENLYNICKKKNLKYLWNRSRGGGLHVWFLFTEAIPAAQANKFIEVLKRDLYSFDAWLFKNGDPNLKKSIKCDIRPGSNPGLRVIFPEGKVYNNPLFSWDDVKGELPQNIDRFTPTITPEIVRDNQSETKKRKPRIEIEKDEEDISDVVRDVVNHIRQQKKNAAMAPKNSWGEDNTRKDVETESIQASAMLDPHFEGFEDNIKEVMPCILARIVLGPQLSEKWSLTIFNVSLSCLAIFGIESEDQLEKALDLTTRIMNHPNMDWENRPQSSDYYRSNGSFSGALKWIREGKSPSCHSFPVDPMKEHCRPGNCALARGGFQYVPRVASQEETVNVDPIYFIKRVEDPFLNDRDKARLYAPEFIVDHSRQVNEMLIELPDQDIISPTKFQQAMRGRVPDGYDFTELLDGLQFILGNPRGKLQWQVAWQNVLQSKRPETLNVILFETEFIDRFKRELRKQDCQRIENKRVGSVLVEKLDPGVNIYFSRGVIMDIISATAHDLRRHPPDYKKCEDRYMKEVFEAELVRLPDQSGVPTTSIFWKVKLPKLEEKQAIPSKMEQQISVEVSRTLSPGSVADMSSHRDKREREAKIWHLNFLDKNKEKDDDKEE